MRQRPHILLDARWLDIDGRRNVLGLARVAQEVARRLPPLDRLEGGLTLLHPAEPVWLTGVLLARRPRLFYSPGFNVPPTCPTPFVFTVFDLIHLHIPEISSAAKRLYYQLLVKPSVRRAQAVLTGSEYSRRQIIEWSGVDAERVVVIGCGVAAEFVPNGDAHQPGFPYLLHVGNLKPHKNVERLIRAFARTEDRDVRLLLTGEPDSRLLSLAADEGICDRLVFMGRVPDEQLASLYRGTVALVFPSLYEGFGLPPLEAMACGTPVISSTTTSLAEVVGGAAFPIDPLDVESITAGIDQVVRDDQLRRKLSALGLAQARNFSWELTAERAWKALRRGLSESSH